MNQVFNSCIGLMTLVAGDLACQGTTWTLRASGTPSAREGAPGSYDAARRCVVMFGGYLPNVTMSSETWLWDGAVWRLTAPSRSPDARADHATAFDEHRRLVVLFGGATIQNAVLDDTWEWNGQDWTRVMQGGPARRFRHAMAYDASRRRVVVFGGLDETGFGYLGDTWEWDGSAWQQRYPSSHPAGRRDARMVYDRERSRIVLFGGHAGGILTPPFDDTWEWDGATWTRATPAHRPRGRFEHAMVYDETRSRVVLFGGRFHQFALFANDTWEWDGSDWRERMPANSPSPRVPNAAAYHAASSRMVMFGGRGLDATGWPYDFDDTWEYVVVNPASYEPFGSSCPGSQSTPRLAARGGQRPWAGDMFGVELSGLPPGQPVVMLTGFSDTMWGNVRLPLPLDGIGMPGCVLYTEPAIDTGLANDNGTATWTVPLPTVPGVLGLRFFNQGVVFDPGANLLGIVATNAGAGVIGAR